MIMSQMLTVQPHPAVDTLLRALDVAPHHIDHCVVQLNALIDGSHSYCWTHHDVEPARAGRCIECGHGWNTDQQLIDEDYEVARGLWPNQAVPAYSVNMVFVCPACAHDL